MKLAPNLLGNYEYAFRQAEFVRSDVKYDNRPFAAASLRFWPMAQNAREKPQPDEDLPDNVAPAALAEGYARAAPAPGVRPGGRGTRDLR